MNFIAAKPNEKNPYFQAFSKFVDSQEDGSLILEDWEQLEKTKKETADRIIDHLIQLACDSQNASNINIGRFYLQKTRKSWLLERIEKLLPAFLEHGDYWNYLRALEVFSTIDESLTNEIAIRAIVDGNEEIREIGENFLNK